MNARWPPCSGATPRPRWVQARRAKTGGSGPAPTPPLPVADSLAAHVSTCPPELAARLALVHVADDDDGRSARSGRMAGHPGGQLRRWDGFVARGEGGAEAARLEAENRFAELEAELPAKRALAAEAEALEASVRAELGTLQLAVIAAERGLASAADAERAHCARSIRPKMPAAAPAPAAAELAAAAATWPNSASRPRLNAPVPQQRRAALPDPEAGRAALAAAQAQHEAARQAVQGAAAALSAQDQALAVARERTAAQRTEISGWQARAGDAASRLAEMGRRFEEIEEERAVVAAKPASLIREIEAGDAVRDRLGTELAEAEAALAAAGETARTADQALAGVNEALATAREARAGAAARAENEEARRNEMAAISGERFQCPPPLLPGRFEFAADSVAGAFDESAAHDRLIADRERLGPVNLVAADELASAEAKHGESLAEQAELTEAVHRLRGSIGNLNREGRERLRAAFEAVDTHFRRLFTRLFEGGQAHLALVDSDDPLEAGLEIFAQPPGKRLQSLTLLSGGEQALTAIALIFALFLTNPAPICVLDEVDAPLDDANIERFCDLLDAMVLETDTRYLIVTHNAVTMSRMHRLFGVTMVEQGVSRLVSVDLGAAEELLAAE